MADQGRGRMLLRCMHRPAVGGADRRKVQAATIRLGTQNASSKYHGRCSLCGQVALVTSINRHWF
jgi:hypothetical protein